MKINHNAWYYNQKRPENLRPQSLEPFRQCLTNLDLNMVRAGAVAHPERWPVCGYVEIQHPKVRYGDVDYERLMELMGVSKLEQLQQVCRQQV
jgi:putative transposase